MFNFESMRDSNSRASSDGGEGDESSETLLRRGTAASHPSSAKGPHLKAVDIAEFEAGGTSRSWTRPPFARLRYQIPVAVGLIAFVPAVMLDSSFLLAADPMPSTINTFIAMVLASIAAVLMFRRLGTYPGISSFGQVVPAVIAPMGAALAFIVAARLDYSRALLFMSASIAAILFSALWVYYRRHCQLTVYLLPGAKLPASPNMVQRPLDYPIHRLQQNSIVVADLRADHSPEWERFMLTSALLGIPVYHMKHLAEGISGRVEIEHLTENVLGSVVPSSAYIRVKRALDLAASLVALPFLLPVLLVISVAVRLERGGSVFFVQERVGFRGKRFRMVKFRTMRPVALTKDSDARAVAMTSLDDERITKVGRFLRRHRLDELPQIYNILRGDMSWIGPRPEAVALSSWYSREINFYGYRHMVRPGITGWAQINQGHVVTVDAVTEKLQYDFYYIKHFSPWLDVLIVLRTVKTLFFGVGAR